MDRRKNMIMATPKPITTLQPSASEKLKNDIELTRISMDLTLERLYQRIKPRHLVEDVMGFFDKDPDENGDRTTRTVREAGQHAISKLKEHTIPATMIGAGLAWLLIEDKHAARETTQSPDSQLPTTQQFQPAAEKRSAMSLTSLANEAPFAMGLAALAFGLIAGIVLPASPTENENTVSHEMADDLEIPITGQTNRATYNTTGVLNSNQAESLPGYSNRYS